MLHQQTQSRKHGTHLWYKPHIIIFWKKAADTKCRALLLAISAKETGVHVWLNALPIYSLGLRMDDNVIQIAVGLCLGIAICHPHQCHHCKATEDELGSHGLSCSKSEGHLPRHAAINSIIQRSLMLARIPSILESAGLSWFDGK